MLTAERGCSQASLDSVPPGRPQASASCCSIKRDPYRADRGSLASRSQDPSGLSVATLRPHSCSRPKVTANPSSSSEARSLGSRVKGLLQGCRKLGSRMLFTWRKQGQLLQASLGGWESRPSIQRARASQGHGRRRAMESRDPELSSYSDLWSG